MPSKPVVIISSTALDLPEYRTQVVDACLRGDVMPKMMEHLPALAADAIRASLGLVDEADIYVGIFAHRYGYVPDGHDVSITQMEYERAVERGIPRLIFIISDEVPVLPKDYDRGESAEKLEALKERLQKEQVVAFFKNPEDLRGHVHQSLAEVQKKLVAARTEGSADGPGASLAASLHYISGIPTPPEPYIAHPYTLLQVRRLIGRKDEMEKLTDWVTGKQFKDVRIFGVVAIGGMGKSALTWTWFNDVAPQEMSPLAGRVWWSFYESDATFENFVTRALAYVSRQPLAEIKRLTLPEREEHLLHLLDREPFLLVLDGVERILIAYARLDATYLRDDDSLDDEAANRVAGMPGLPANAGQSFVGKHGLRMTSDPRAGRFLRRLAQVRASRTLISTRLFPADLHGPGGAASPGCHAESLHGLTDQDALELWREYSARGSREEMLPLFGTFKNHPLLLQLLAYEVADFHDAPGDFDAWRRANPDFNPYGPLQLANVQSHVLAYALRGLSAAELRTLHVIAGFRMPASMDAMRGLLICTDDHNDPSKKPFRNLRALDEALTNLEDRGLLGWDRRGNRYDLHPIVRGVVWTELDDVSRMALYGTLRDHFAAIPTPDYLEVDSLNDLTPAIELYNNLIRLQRYDEAAQVFQDRLDEATHFRLSASRLRVELLEALFPHGLNGLPSLSPAALSSTLNSLALAYNLSGRPGAAVSLLRRADEIDLQENDLEARSVGLGNLADALRLSGNLRAAESYARTALAIAREDGSRILEGASLSHIGLVLIARGELKEATSAFRRALRIWRRESIWQSEGWVSAYLAEIALREGDAETALFLADRGWEIAEALRNERELIHAARMQGTALLRLQQFVQAGERLHDALLRARTVSLVEEELPTLVALADWHRQLEEVAQAKAMLDDVRSAAEDGPYPLFYADALNVSTQLSLDQKRNDAALATATHAYNLAWCDGPPFAYSWGLEQAKRHLVQLGTVELRLPAFDESIHNPMPEVEINPPDEFRGDD